MLTHLIDLLSTLVPYSVNFLTKYLTKSICFNISKRIILTILNFVIFSETLSSYITLRVNYWVWFSIILVVRLDLSHSCMRWPLVINNYFRQLLFLKFRRIMLKQVMVAASLVDLIIIRLLSLSNCIPK